MAQNNGGFVDPQFEYKRNQLDKAYKQMTAIQKSIDNIISSHETLEKVNKNNVSAYKYLHTPGHMQFQDGITVGQAHEKTLNVHSDCLSQLKTLRLNFIKWLSEYGSMQNKLKLRDQFKVKYDKAETDLQTLYNQKDMQAKTSQDLQLRINRAEKDVDFLRSNFMNQNQKCYEALKELVTDKHKMMNPILTKYLQINHIFYSKALSHFECIGAIDPAKLFIHRSIYGDEKSQKPTAAVSAEMQAAEIQEKQNPIHDPHLERMKKIDGADPNAYLTNMDAYRDDFIENPIQEPNPDPQPQEKKMSEVGKSPSKYGKFDKIISGVQAQEGEGVANQANFDEDDARASASQVQIEQEMAQWKEDQRKNDPSSVADPNYPQQDQNYYNNGQAQAAGGYDNYNYDAQQQQYDYDQQQYNGYDQQYNYDQQQYNYQDGGYDQAQYPDYNQDYNNYYEPASDYANQGQTEEQKQQYQDKFKSFYQGYNNDDADLKKQISKNQDGFGDGYLGAGDFGAAKDPSPLQQQPPPQQQPPQQQPPQQQQQPAAKEFGGFNFGFLDEKPSQPQPAQQQQPPAPSMAAGGSNPFSGGQSQQQKQSIASAIDFNKDNFATSNPGKYDVLGQILGGGGSQPQQQPQGYGTEPQKKSDDPFAFLMNSNNAQPQPGAMGAPQPGSMSGAGAGFANSFNQPQQQFNNQFGNMNLGGTQSNPFNQPAFAGLDPGTQQMQQQQQQQPPSPAPQQQQQQKDEFADLLNF